MEMTMRRLMRKFVLGTGSVLALGIGGATLNNAADAGNGVNAGTTPPISQVAESSPSGDSFRKDNIRWAQVELREQGFYKGSLDGVLGPQTKQALGQFQTKDGLARTALLDAQTWDALTSNPDIGQGSSMPPHGDRNDTMTNSSPASDLGR
jgi:peptidoglycan hydrolase-like protein with peptidoglycan-binding domain